MNPVQKVLIVHAHPEPQSFSSALAYSARESMEARNLQVQVSDLYAMGFNPVATRDDFLSLKNPDYLVYALEQRHGFESHSLAPDIAAELDKLLWCDLLILNFPLFWGSVPAMLKGWIDRVMVSGRCYGGKRFYDRGGLTGKRALISLTLGGQRHMFGPEGIHGPLESLLSPLLRTTLAYTGMSVLQPFVGWHVPYVSDQIRQDFLAQWRVRLESLDTEGFLTFPRLGDFDESLYPIAR